MNKNTNLGEVIIEAIAEHRKNVVAFLVVQTGLSRQAINKRIRSLIEEGVVKAEGNTNARRYTLPVIREYSDSFLLKGADESLLWRYNIAPLLANLPDNVKGIWGIGFTEMANNAVDHSGGTNLRVMLQKTATTTSMYMVDDGVGIFRKIKAGLRLEDERHAVLELSKGKLTTDPIKHTGQGIFFTSRMFDHFHIYSGEVFYSHAPDEDEDWILEVDKPEKGTIVFMSINDKSARTAKEVYDKFSSRGQDYAFSRTIVPVRLLKHGQEQLVSRSQAKRLLARFDAFKTVILDFKGIDEIGQAFADEVFRVFPDLHPEVKLVVFRANKQIKQFIQRAKAGALALPLFDQVKGY